MDVRSESKISEMFCSALFCSFMLNNQVIIKYGNCYQYHHQHHYPFTPLFHRVHSHHCYVHLGGSCWCGVCAAEVNKPLANPHRSIQHRHHWRHHDI